MTHLDRIADAAEHDAHREVAAGVDEPDTSLAAVLRCVATIRNATTTLTEHADRLTELDAEKLTGLTAAGHTISSLVDLTERSQ